MQEIDTAELIKCAKHCLADGFAWECEKCPYDKVRCIAGLLEDLTNRLERYNKALDMACLQICEFDEITSTSHQEWKRWALETGSGTE